MAGSIVQRSQTNWNQTFFNASTAQGAQPAAAPMPANGGQVAQPAGPGMLPSFLYAQPGQNQPQQAQPQDPPWWDMGAHVGNIYQGIHDTVASHGGEAVGHFFDQSDDNHNPIGVFLNWVTKPVTTPIAIQMDMLNVMGQSFQFGTRVAATGVQAITFDNPLYRDGVGLDDLATMWNATESTADPNKPYVGLGPALGQGLGQAARIFQREVMHKPDQPADYTAPAPIFDVGFDPYHLTDEQHAQLKANPVYGIGTGSLDVGAQVAIAAAGNKGATLLTRAAGLRTAMNVTKDLPTLDTALQTEGTPAYAMNQQLAATRDVNVIRSNPLVDTRSPHVDAVVQMLSQVTDPNDARLIILADKGYRPAITTLFKDAPEHIFALKSTTESIAEEVAKNGRVGDYANQFIKASFDSHAEKNAFYKRAVDAFLTTDDNGVFSGFTQNSTKMPFGTTGGNFLGKPGDLLGHLQMTGAATGRDIMEGKGILSSWEDADNWAMRTIGRAGSGYPVTRTLQWMGGRKPIGLVSLSGLRPHDLFDEMNAYVDSATWTIGAKRAFTFIRDSQPVTMNGAQYRAEMKTRLSQAQAQGSTAVQATVSDIEQELISTIALKRNPGMTSAESIDFVKNTARSLQAKRDGDAADIQARGYFYDGDGAKVMVDPLFVRQLADSVHLVPLKAIDRELGGHFEGANIAHQVDRVYEGIQRVWRTGILFKPAYTLKNSVAEPIVASILAHGTMMAPDGMMAVGTHVMANLGHRAATIGLAATDRVTQSLAGIPGVRSMVADTYGGKQAQLSRLQNEMIDANRSIEHYDAEIKAIGTGEKSPAWEAANGDLIRREHAAAQQRLRDIGAELENLSLLDNMPHPNEVYTPLTRPEMVAEHARLVDILREDPALAESRINGQADILQAKVDARAAKVQTGQEARLEEGRQALKQTADNVTSVQKRNATAYAIRVEDALEKAKQRVARYEAANPDPAARTRALSRDEQARQGGYQGGMTNLHSQWPMVSPADAGIQAQARAEVESLSALLDRTKAHIADLSRPDYAGTPAHQAYLDSLQGTHTVSLPDSLYLPGEREKIALLRAQADEVRHIPEPVRAEHLAALDEVKGHLDTMAEALNTPQMETYALRKAAEDRLRQVSEKIAKVSSESAMQRRTREKYHERVLSGTAPVVYDVSSGRAEKLQYLRRGEANRVGKQWKANQDAISQGRHEDVVPLDDKYRVAPGLFDQNAFGEAYRAEFSATLSQRAAYDPRGFADLVGKRFVRSGGSDVIDPNILDMPDNPLNPTIKYAHPDYWNELSHIVNRQIRMDDAAKLILAGKSPAYMRQWIQSPAGMQYADRMGWTADTATSSINDMHRLLNQYLNPGHILPDDLVAALRKEGHQVRDGANVQDLATLKDVTPGDLQAAMARNTDLLSPIHSGEVAFQKPTYWGRAMDRIWHTLATHPEERIGRFPGGQRYYENFMKQQMDSTLAQGGEVTPAVINGMRHTAATRALMETERTYYNIRRYSNPIYSLRYITAFPGALFNSMYRVARLSSINPGTGMFMADKFTNGFVKVGLDQNNKPTQDFRKVTHLVFDVPDFMKNTFGIQDQQMSIGLQSLDFVMPSPSFSWTVAVPLDSMLAKKPELAQWIKDNTDPSTQSMFFPFGDPVSKGRFTIGPVVLDSLVPSHVRDFMTMMQQEGDQRWVQTVDQYLQEMSYEWEKNGKNGPPPKVEDAQQAAKAHWQMEFALKFAVFGGLSLQPAGQMERNDWQNIQNAHGSDYKGAVAEFTKKYGTGSAWFTKSTTQRPGGVPANFPSWNRMTDNPDLVKQIMTASGMTASDSDHTRASALATLFADTTGGFDKAVYNAETHTRIPGTDITIGDTSTGSAEWLASARASNSWQEYTSARDVLKATMLRYGYTNIQQKDAAWLHDQWKSWFNGFAADKDNSDWLQEYNKRDFGVASRTLQSINAITSNQKFMTGQKDNPYFQAMNEYMHNYAIAVTAYRTTTDPSQRSRLADQWDQWVQANVATDSKTFSDVYARYLEGNDLKVVG